MRPTTETSAYGQRHDFTFKAQDCRRTLAEGMAEFAAAQPELLVPTEPGLAEFMRAHDACHVLFGLGTELTDEAVADTWTMLVTDMTVRRYTAYLGHPELRALFGEVGTWPMLLGALRSLPRLCRVFWRAREVARWSFWGYADHLDTPLADLRARLAIRLV
jgi:hypothetical protein